MRNLIAPFGKFGVQFILLWLLFVIIGVWTKGVILFYGSLAIIIYAVVQLVKKQQKRGVIYLGIGGGFFILSLILGFVYMEDLKSSQADLSKQKQSKRMTKKEQTKKPLAPAKPELSFEATSITTRETKNIIKGTTEPGATVMVYFEDTFLYNDQHVDLRTDGKGHFQYEASTPFPGRYPVRFQVEQGGMVVNEQVVTIKREDTPDFEAAFKQSSKMVKYGLLAKNPDAYKGERLKIKGKVLDIREFPHEGQIILSTTRKGNGEWEPDDIVKISYNGTNDIVKRDVITVYGIGHGDYAYLTSSDKVVYIPLIKSLYIEKAR
ncbi:hypothetical protein [Laceyella putida]|uniref:DUF4131 domain-containing protein n=1 Tax=Laceyella putida TaxID=110101 RepID=A0ABW2RGZ5_9BACL